MSFLDGYLIRVSPRFNELYAVSRKDGDPLLIDTPKEYEELKKVFLNLTGKNLPPNYSRFQVNFSYSVNLNGAEHTDLIPIPPTMVVGLYVFGMGGSQDVAHFFWITEERWKELVAPLANGAKDAGDERKKLAIVIKNIKNELAIDKLNEIASEEGWSGFSMQNCVDTSLGVREMILALEYKGLLKFHFLDPKKPFFNQGVVHTAVRLQEKESSKTFVVDAYVEKDRVVVINGENFRDLVQVKYPFGPKY